MFASRSLVRVVGGGRRVRRDMLRRKSPISSVAMVIGRRTHRWRAGSRGMLRDCNDCDDMMRALAFASRESITFNEVIEDVSTAL